jgi:hypothetical protein
MVWNVRIQSYWAQAKDIYMYIYIHTQLAWRSQAMRDLYYLTKYGIYKGGKVVANHVYIILSAGIFFGEGGCLGSAIMALHSLHLQWCCQGDMMAKGKYVSRVGGSGSEGVPGTTWNRSSECNHCILMYRYLYSNSMAVWPTVAKSCISIKPHMAAYGIPQNLKLETHAFQKLFHLHIFPYFTK